MRKAIAVELDEAQREQLVKLARSDTTEVRLARRARRGAGLAAPYGAGILP
jgi:hypothetical protein